MSIDADALVIGAGPAGASTAIRLAAAGWDVVLAEKSRYPRQKVCGECIAAGNLELLDELGIGCEFRRLAGPDLRQVGWMSAARTVVADMPPCPDGPYRYGRALGRDRLDVLLLERARSVGVRVLQPARVRTVAGGPGQFECEYEASVDRLRIAPEGRTERTLRARVVIDAHGSWERAPAFTCKATGTVTHAPRLNSDLFAFKASFRNTRVPIGFLPVLALNGGYGGMVVAEDGRTTIACCIRRDALQSWRGLAPGESAGIAIEGYLRRSCRGIRDSLENAIREGPWLSVGPVRTGVHIEARGGVLRVGNAAGETHPLVGEGIGMALQSAALLTRHLTCRSAAAFNWTRSLEVQAAYAASWKRKFAPRLRVAHAYASVAMNPALASPTGVLLRRLPKLLTVAARLAGKARAAASARTLLQELT